MNVTVFGATGAIGQQVGRNGPAAPSGAARVAQSPPPLPPNVPPARGAPDAILPPSAGRGTGKALVSRLTRASPSGVSDGARTRDTQDHNLVLYQLSYTHHAPAGRERRWGTA